jgi:LL-diaminopimelate aminotransferase
MENARILREAVTESGLSIYGGVNAPYIWVRGPERSTSWEIFDRVLNEANIVITPGSGFGSAGEGYFRISAFNSRANAEDAAQRFAAMRW